MAASVSVFENGWPVAKPWIKLALSEMIGKKYQILDDSSDLDGQICTPVFVMFTTRYDTRLVCKLDDSDKHESVFCNQLVPYPLKATSPLPKCAMKVPLLTDDEIRSYLKTAIRLCDKKADIWARREMVKIMLMNENFEPFPCNELPPFFNNTKFDSLDILQRQTMIKLQEGCPHGGYVDFKRFGEGICTNDRCFYCSFSECQWYYGRKWKIHYKFNEFLKTGRCNDCCCRSLQVEKEHYSGGIVKFAKSVLDSNYGKDKLSKHNETEEESSDDDDDSVISSVDTYPGHMVDWDDDFCEPSLCKRSIIML